MTATSRVQLIENRLRAALSPSRLEIIDDSHKHAGHAGAAAGGGHFQVRIQSAAFVGKTPIQRHRLVYDALAELMHTVIHALSIQAETPDS
jgi:BolA family transcriptional regulator, general stress-responsive regulator